MKDERMNMLNEANKLNEEIVALQADIRSVTCCWFLPQTRVNVCQQLSVDCEE